ncbi:MAG: acetyl/propionyl/methylcrotonyl-CoA carboxylase subunit alpha [Parasphingorhabdus sp.]|uniref:acetyl/propionyl/methylcrotonyl-CoA carboxylase subunit alpha n=1 Tax=Parasphingorhabdus sp. TaxID=2709688 RepID=UPI003297D50B
MFKKILIANRGEIACRVIKTAKKMGIATVAVYSDADARAPFVRMADEAVHIGPPPAAESYLIADKIIAACKETGAEAVHPGYGFLSERASFVEELEKNNIAFIGPPPNAIAAMGDKIESKKLAMEAGVNVVPGFVGEIDDTEHAVKISNDIGYPVMMKASAGGGGKGMRLAYSEKDVREGFEATKREGLNSFGDDRVFIEKFIEDPRHIEIQILGDKHGNVLYLNERECSIQRRHQKVVEEAPSPFVTPKMRKAMGEQCVALSAAVDYHSAGTVELIVSGADKTGESFYFLEMNTRLQVEHPVTEAITGIDLVEQMIRVAAGEELSIKQSDVGINGWAMESRLYAEDPYRGFLPSIGRLTRYRPPEEVAEESRAVRNDTGVFEGGEISMFYDPMIAKLCTWAPTREAAIEEMRVALDTFEVEGIGHNIPFLAAVYDHPKFISGDMTTAFIEEEYPDGFEGVTLSKDVLKEIAQAAAAMQFVSDSRDLKISGQMVERKKDLERDYVIDLGGVRFTYGVLIEPDAYYYADASVPEMVTVWDDETPIEINLAWKPGASLARIHQENSEDGGLEWFGDVAKTLKVERRPSGYRIRYRGADLDVKVQSPRVAELYARMPVKTPPDTSKLLLCPMPGLIVKVDVDEGDEVQEGQALCTVEAMKMENILRAEKKGVVAKINAAAGDSLKVDDVIMEFE